jgi:long-chain acyl-CoA synthetase
MAREACRRRADQPLLHYFDAALSGNEVAAASDALACHLAGRGVRAGDRVALYLQNVPAFPIALIAAWKLGAIAVPINPMLREREVAGILDDCGAKAAIALDSLADRLPTLPVLLATSDAGTFAELPTGEQPPAVSVAPGDVATLCYTSGTTGPPKGAMNTHANVIFTSRVWHDWPGLGEGDVNLALAPLFHITGLIAGVGASLYGALPLVLGHRFEPEATLELIARHRPTFTVAAITAFQALMRSPGFADADLSCLRAVYTGGAPVAPAVADAWREATGVALHDAYGLTETTSPLTLTPQGSRGPAGSVGVPVWETSVEILGDDGAVLGAGEVGEIVAAGPQVVPGYWGKPEETAHALPDGRLRTGDVGYLDEEGWLYIVDRRKDMIIASGYKVWPREVEDVLYTHPAVTEAAVVGVPDEYRGETVKAFVAVRSAVEPDELIGFCRERMAAYKYPRLVEIVDELPKSATGKVLRRELRG